MPQGLNMQKGFAFKELNMHETSISSNQPEGHSEYTHIESGQCGGCG